MLGLRARSLAIAGQLSAAVRDYTAMLELPEPPYAQKLAESDEEGSEEPVESARHAAHRRMVCSALSRRATLNQKLSEWEDAAADCRRWLAMDPGNPLARTYLEQSEEGARKAAKHKHGSHHSSRHGSSKHGSKGSKKSHSKKGHSSKKSKKGQPVKSKK